MTEQIAVPKMGICIFPLWAREGCAALKMPRCAMYNRGKCRLDAGTACWVGTRYLFLATRAKSDPKAAAELEPLKKTFAAAIRAKEGIVKAWEAAQPPPIPKPAPEVATPAPRPTPTKAPTVSEAPPPAPEPIEPPPPPIRWKDESDRLTVSQSRKLQLETVAGAIRLKPGWKGCIVPDGVTIWNPNLDGSRQTVQKSASAHLWMILCEEDAQRKQAQADIVFALAQRAEQLEAAEAAARERAQMDHWEQIQARIRRQDAAAANAAPELEAKPSENGNGGNGGKRGRGKASIGRMYAEDNRFLLAGLRSQLPDSIRHLSKITDDGLSFPPSSTGMGQWHTVSSQEELDSALAEIQGRRVWR